MTINGVGSATMSPVYTGGERVSHDSGGGEAPAQAQQASSPPPSQTAAAAIAAHAQAKAQAQEQASDADLEKLMEEPVRQANNALRPFDRQIEREIHEVTKALMYKIRDTKTNEVIAEYPPKKIQDMIAKMWELAGLFIDQKA